MSISSPQSIIPVILAGGKGQRLWPVCDGAVAKPFICLDQNSQSAPSTQKSAFQETVSRVSTHFSALVILCHEDSQELATAQLTALGLSPNNYTILTEPCARDTAPAIALAAHYIRDHHDVALMAVMPSDHEMEMADIDAFLQAIEDGAETAREGDIIVFGSPPTYASIDFGYMKCGHKNAALFTVASFIEKPCLSSAERYCGDGNYLWNMGVFLMRPDRYLEELARYADAIADAVSDYVGNHNRAAYESITPLSIDYAVLEHCDRVSVVKTNCDWRDTGSWSAQYDAGDKDAGGNVMMGGGGAHRDLTNSYINDSAGVHVTTIGLDDVVIVTSGDHVFVAKKDRAHEIKSMLHETQRQSDKQAGE